MSSDTSILSIEEILESHEVSPKCEGCRQAEATHVVRHVACGCCFLDCEPCARCEIREVAKVQGRAYSGGTCEGCDTWLVDITTTMEPM